jgi:hypothetical protein
MAQEEQHLRILKTDSTWGSEFFKLPLGFAQEIAFEGTEQAVFPSGWGDTESPQLWTYAFAWKIEQNAELTEAEMATNIEYYFNGLLGLGPEHADKPGTEATFVRKANTTGPSEYAGKIETLDTRITNKPMTLYAVAEQHFCPDTDTLTILFRLSPQKFTSTVWLELGKITVLENICQF